jgi:hypothetical protein
MVWLLPPELSARFKALIGWFLPQSREEHRGQAVVLSRFIDQRLGTMKVE